jgi:hypothetical protein
MANLAAFYFLLVYIASFHLLPSWGYSRIRDTFSTARSGSILLRKNCSVLLTTCCHTPNHTTASTAQLHCPRKHVRFKSTSLCATMPVFAFLELSPMDSMATSVAAVVQIASPRPGQDEVRVGQEQTARIKGGARGRLVK